MGWLEIRPTRYIFVRHLETTGTEIRTRVKADPRYHVYNVAIQEGSLDTLAEVKQTINQYGPSLRRDYPNVDRDALLPLVGGQEAWGQAIGKAVEEKYGPITKIEVSPYLRTVTTLAYLREGSAQLASLPVKVDKEVRERELGPVAEILPFARLYYYLHPEELARYYADRKNHRFPGGESEPDIKRRAGEKARSLEWSLRYAGETTLQVGHSRMIAEQVAYLMRPTFAEKLQGVIKSKYSDLFVDTGSITVLEAKPRILPFLRRRFRIVAVDEHVSQA